jgi:hypothetical protein
MAEAETVRCCSSDRSGDLRCAAQAQAGRSGPSCAADETRCDRRRRSMRRTPFQIDAATAPAQRAPRGVSTGGGTRIFICSVDMTSSPCVIGEAQ